MKCLNFYKNEIYLQFCIDDENRLLINHIGTEKGNLTGNSFFTPTEVFVTGENPNDHHGAKHTGNNLLKYESYYENENELVFVMNNGKIRVTQHYDFFKNVKVVRSYAEIENISKEKMGLEYAASFCLYGFDINRLWLCHNAWCRELQWQTYSPRKLGYNHISNFSTKRIAVSNTGTWSTKEYMPMGIIENKSECIFWQIENNGSWNFEISDIQNQNYLKLSGPSEQENGWWKELNPGEIFETIKAAIGFEKNINGVFGEMTKYRRTLAYRSEKDAGLPVIFNDYMMCLNADPATEKELAVIDAAAKVGAEIYCMDAGWYADGTWWKTVGEWKVCEGRFKNGMGEVFDYIRQKGMKPGIWLEPEVMGINCPILYKFTDDCFFTRHGKKVIDHGRYHFDFRNKKVTDFLNGVVDGLINDYGIEYFKFDYNIDGGVGTEIDSDSFGDGLMEHCNAYLNWVDGLYSRHPGLIIENCASGGMRMDYKSLSHFSMQSLSDAADYDKTAVISAMSGTAVIPEQAQVWVVPMRTDTLDEVVLNMVNAMFLRPVISGETHLLSDEQFEVLKNGIDFYKSIRKEIPKLIPFYPLGTAQFGDDWVVCGFSGEKFDYICVKRLGDSESVEIPINCCKYGNIELMYPQTNNCTIKTYKNLYISLPCNSGAVIRVAKHHQTADISPNCVY